MSTLTGRWQWTGRALDEDVWAAQVAENSLGKHHRQGGTSRPQAGLALHSEILAFDRWSAAEQQPYVFANGSVLTWDGRLDNRDDLLVTVRRYLTSDLSDVALVAAAYERWGADAFARLLGDWCLALWDSTSRTVVLACDYMAGRQLYYTEFNDGLAWASRLGALAVGRPDIALDRAYIAGTLLDRLPSNGTPFVGISRLPAGQMVSAQQQHVVLRRYWHMAASRVVYRDPRDYAAHARVLMIEAVRLRLRTEGSVWAQLSGGWDSSGIVCVAQGLIRGGAVEATRLLPVSVVSSEALDSDESPYIEAVERWCQLQSKRVEYPGAPSFAELLQRRQYLPGNAGYMAEASITGVGSGIVLTGSLGDYTMLRIISAFAMLESVAAGRPVEFLRLYRAYARAYNRPFARSLLNFVLAAFAPDISDRVNEWTRRRRQGKAKMTPQETAKNLGIHASMLEYLSPLQPPLDVDVQGDSIVQRHMIEGLYRLQTVTTYADRYPTVWQTDPYTHRPLVEFAIALQQLTFWKPKRTRVAMSEIFAHVLPPEILSRTTKGIPSAAFNHAAKRQADQVRRERDLIGPLDRWELVTRAFVSDAALRQALNDVEAQGKVSPMLARCLALEAWLRTLPSITSSPARTDFASRRRNQPPERFASSLA